jgi:uncharacterized protein (DUF58 family)
MPLFGPDWLLDCEKLTLAAGGGWLVGAKRGTGREAWFGHRDYAPGDDLWRVDWHICARHDELRIRPMAAVSQTRVYLLVDCSQSMAVGANRKFDAARRVAAALAQAALSQRAIVSVAAFADGLVGEIGPLCGRGRIPTVLRFLESLEPRPGATDLGRAATALVRRPVGRGPAVVIGDLIEPAGFKRGLETIRRAGYSLSVVHLYDPAEAEPGFLGDVELCDAESGEVVRGTVTERDLARYREQFAGFRGVLQSYCRRASIGCVSIAADLAPGEILLRTLGPRALSGEGVQ